MDLDITAIIDLIVNGISQIYTFMYNIRFLGTNLLTFLITIFIISALLPVLLTLVRTTNAVSERSYKERIKRKDDK